MHTLQPALREAGERLREQREIWVPLGATEEELEEALDCFERTLLTGDLEPVRAAHHMVRGSLCRRLLPVLQRELLDIWAHQETPPSSENLLLVLRRMEDARAVLTTPTDNFTAELAGPNGLELVAEIVHDLRSPLTSIMFLADTLRKGQSGEINEIQRQQLGITYSAALGLVSVASNVIELARDGGMLPDADPAPFVLADVLESVRALVAPMAEEKGLEVVVDAPSAQEIRMGHAIALSRVLLNLTTNAIKFSEKGRVRVTVEPTGEDTFAFSVQDTGRGIEPDVAVRMFEPFQRRDTGLRFSGTGLGLSICRRLVRAMGGELAYETDPGNGTRFFFELQLPAEAP